MMYDVKKSVSHFVMGGEAAFVSFCYFRDS